MKRRRNPAIKVWEVKAGNLTRHYFTAHHADQMARALSLNGMQVAVRECNLPSDALTRLTVQ